MEQPAHVDALGRADGTRGVPCARASEAAWRAPYTLSTEEAIKAVPRRSEMMRAPGWGAVRRGTDGDFSISVCKCDMLYNKLLI